MKEEWEQWRSKMVNYEWHLYKKKMLNRLKNEDFTIIASNCNGTIMYSDLGLRFLSPTINLTIDTNDFFKMVENLKWYMEQKIVEVNTNMQCPVGLLGDIKIYFVHYKTFEEGVAKWEERKKRINWDNIFIVGTARNKGTYQVLQRFEDLPYKNKVMFTNVPCPEYPSTFYIKGFEKENGVGVLTDYKKQLLKRRYLDDFDYVNFLNGKGLRANKGIYQKWVQVQNA